jgi:hypothetical protein
MITNALIASLNPCTDRHNNYLQHYKDKEFSFDDFLDLENISYYDKVWVARIVLNKNQLVHWAILCAQSVLHIFENKQPNDKRPRECLAYLISIEDYSNLTEDQIIVIRKIRRDAAAYAYAAAAAAVDAAAYAADYAAAAAAAAADAAAAAAVDAAADAAAAAAVDAYAAAAVDAYNARKLQQDTNLELLKVASII